MSIENYSQYLTYSKEDMRWQITCTDVGATHIMPYSSYPPDRGKHPNPYKNVSVGRILNEYQIIYITRGTGVFRSEKNSYEVTSGTIMLLFPGVAHSYHPYPATGWDEYWVGFMGNYPDKLLKEGIITHKNPIVNISLSDVIHSIYMSIFEEVRNQKTFYQLKIGANIMLLLAEILSNVRNQQQDSKNTSLVNKAKFIFQEEIFGNIEIETVAQRLGVSEPHLREIFKEYVGMTPYQYYLHLKINKAKEYLSSGDLLIKEIAYKLSFEDQYYFSKLFKKKTGISPSHWNITTHDF